MQQVSQRRARLSSMTLDRRRFLVLAAASVALPPALARAYQIDARSRSGTIEDVGHIVILMQENRSFDHYFGTMNGVRGFGDRQAVTFPDGDSVFRQPDRGRSE